MNNKIIGIYVCILLTSFPILSVVGAINHIIVEETSTDNNFIEQNIISENLGDWHELIKLTAYDAALKDRFGNSVDISGDYAIVGSYFDDDMGTDSGSAYIYRLDGSDWIFDEKLIASDAAKFNAFGTSVAISGNYVIVGSPCYDMGSYVGAAYIFKKDESGWIEEAKLTASDGEHGDFFGGSVSIDGDYAVIGAPHANPGSVYIFKHNISGWIEEEKLTATDNDSIVSFGCSVSIDGGRVIVGDDHNVVLDNRTGAAYIFKHDTSGWIEEAKMTASDGDDGDRFGNSVDISGYYAIVGAHWDEELGYSSGSAYIFKHEGSDWMEEEKLTAHDGERLDLFGESVSINGNHAAIGAIWDDDMGSYSGSVYIFTHDRFSWIEEEKLTASDGDDGNNFGSSVSIEGNQVIVGTPRDEKNDPDSGSAYIFKWEGMLEVEIQPGFHIESYPINYKNIGSTGCSNIEWELTFTKIIGSQPSITSGTFLFLAPDDIRTLNLIANKLFSFTALTAKATIYDQIFIDDAYAINFGSIIFVI